MKYQYYSLIHMENTIDAKSSEETLKLLWTTLWVSSSKFSFHELPRFAMNETYGSLERLVEAVNTLPLL